MVLYVLIAVGGIALIEFSSSYLSQTSTSMRWALKARPLLTLGAILMIGQPINICAQEPPNAQPLTEVGILEDVYFGDAFPGPPQSEVEDFYRAIVRVAFYWQGDRWQSYQYSFEQAADDQVACFDFWRQRHWYLRTSDEHYQEVISRGEVRVPTLRYFLGQCVVSAPTETKDRNEEFAGWLYHPVRPPEVLCTRQSSPDTDGWSEQMPVEFSDLPSNVVKEFEKYLLKDVVLEVAQAEVAEKGTVARFVESVSCRSNSRHYAVYQIGINIGETDSDLIDESKMPICGPICIGAGPGEDQDAWLLGDGLKLFFVGDLNGNGDSELVFWIDRYNRNGYLLADSNLRAVATYEWSYH